MSAPILITDKAPVLPCWLWNPKERQWWRYTKFHKRTQFLVDCTHWLPDQPETPAPMNQAQQPTTGGTEGHPAHYAKVTLLVSENGDMHAIDGEQAPGNPEEDRPFIGLERIKRAHERHISALTMQPPEAVNRPTPHPPTPSDAAKEAAREILGHVPPSGIYTEEQRVDELATIIRRALDSATAELRRERDEAVFQWERNTKEFAVVSQAAEARLAAHSLDAATYADELARWQTAFEGWGDEPEQAHDKLIAASETAVAAARAEASARTIERNALHETTIKYQTHVQELQAEGERLNKELKELQRVITCENMDPNGTIWEHAAKVQKENAALRTEVERLTSILHDLADETDLRNIRGTIQHALKTLP